MLKKTSMLSLCIASALCASNPLSHAIAAELERPNFVTIVIDDMGFSDLGFFGGEVPTPNLDQLAEGGIALTNFYAAATSTPSRAMLFTGKDSHAVGAGSMGGFVAGRADDKLSVQPGYEGILTKDVPTFAEVLQQNGYQTMMTGKWDMGEEPGLYAHDRGFELTKGLLLPGGDIHYLTDAEGNLHTTLPPETFYEPLNRETPYNENGQPVPLADLPKSAFSTEYYTDSAIAMLENRDTSRPFYLNVSHIATHTPWQAPSELVQKYVTTYAKGWDVLRQERFERLQANGMLPADAELPPRPEHLRAWDSLTPQEQNVEAHRMAVYAGLIEMLDISVGRLVNHMKASGLYENTVFIVYSDNGAESSDAGLIFEPYRTFIIDNFNTMVEGDYDPNDLSTIGDETWSVSPNEEWAMLSGTPFNQHKVTMFDGGIHVPAFVHYPQAKANGIKYDCMQSVIDIAPTILDMADAPYPDTWNGKPLSPMDGVSMSNLFQGNFSCDADRVLAWEFDGMKAVRHAGWALSQKRFDDTWYLFNLEEDPYEYNDLSAQRPDKLMQLLNYYDQYAAKNNVLEVSGRWYPVLSTMDSAAGETDAGMYGGVAANGGFWLNNTSVRASDTLDISTFFRVAQAHVGSQGEFIVHIKHTPPGGAPAYFAVTDQGFDSAEGLPGFKAGPLPRRLAFTIFEGVLAAPGTFEIMIGYRTGDGLVFGSEPLTFTVE